MERVRDRRAVARVGHEVEVPGEERQGEGRVHVRSSADGAERVRACREVPDQLPSLRVTSERQHDAHALRLPGLAKRKRDRAEADAHGQHRRGSAPHQRVGGEACERVADDHGIVRPEPLRPKGGQVGDRHREAGPGEPIRGPGEASVPLAIGGQAMNEEQTRPRAALPSTRVPQVRGGPVRSDRPRERHDQRRRCHAGQPGVLALGQELDEEVEPGHARRAADPHGDHEEEDEPGKRPSPEEPADRPWEAHRAHAPTRRQPAPRVRGRVLRLLGRVDALDEVPAAQHVHAADDLGIEADGLEQGR